LIPEPKRVFAPAVRQSLQQCSRAAAAAAFALGAVWSAEAQTRSDQFDGFWPLSITPVHQFDADFDRGGSSSVSRLVASGMAGREFGSHVTVGVLARYEYEKWRFSNPTAFGGTAPWTNLQILNLGLDFDYETDSGWGFSVSPSVQWSAETGAAWSKALTYGATLSAEKKLRSDLTLGLGVGVYSEIEKTRAFPFLIVDWDITERWSLNNPFQAGPAGPAGLELSYDLGNRWEVAFGGAYRSYRYRLDDSGPSAGGVGQVDGIPVFLRLSRTFEQLKLDLYGGVVFAGRLTVEYTGARGTASDTYDPAPFVALTLSARF
jgi:hypothetical protein